MVCVPCIVIPILLWVFHKYIQPFILKFWNPWAKNAAISVTDNKLDVDKSTDEYKLVERLITENSVMMFSKTTCNFTKMAKEVLDSVGVNYAIDELDKRGNCKALQDLFEKLTGARTVPRVFVGGKCIGGASETYSLHNQGKLVPLLKESNATFKKTD